ncbi:hypothetical protein F4778DRAFT_126920 [Xylariomycetidae sp. FL2044]|nr:hypothetical protein F4778DRAFT_126920 [Xylariomycetidae sp. FL2044]
MQYRLNIITITTTLYLCINAGLVAAAPVQDPEAATAATTTTGSDTVLAARTLTCYDYEGSFLDILHCGNDLIGVYCAGNWNDQACVDRILCICCTRQYAWELLLIKPWIGRVQWILLCRLREGGGGGYYCWLSSCVRGGRRRRTGWMGGGDDDYECKRRRWSVCIAGGNTIASCCCPRRPQSSLCYLYNIVTPSN